ncbi:putative membrane protein [Pleurocapsa sp. PCC 7327]|uniref:rhomboid family intramembrane serine protease n=1 Tax=Pleurocapsa sp. PCC 7327 TaxID=118163 RepID=UPI00029FF502|nr:rhomboid family intramembrane serine protease [Pleurocapsa sp. PCC 7327]AFY76618.1 putative membrane protein [Pleurocapsa sp. PCC 7327]
MDIARLFLWIICASCLIFLIRAVSVSFRNNRGWIVVSSIILAIALLISSFNSNLAALIGGILWIIFLLIPSIGFSQVNQLTHQHRYREARQLASYLRWLHPADGWQERPKLLLALELAQRGDLCEVITILNNYHKNNPSSIRHTQALIYWMKSDWKNCLLWFQQQIPKKVLLNEPNLLIYYLRTLGETGDLNSLLKSIKLYRKSLEKLGSVQRDCIRMFALAFCGQVTQVKQLFNGPLNGDSENIKIFWLATAQMVAGKTEVAREQLLSLRMSNDFILSNAVEWRLGHSLAEPTQVLDSISRDIIHQIATEIEQESKYKHMTNFSYKKLYITYGLIAINFIFFMLANILGSSENAETLDYLGALIPEKVWLGEWWRLLSANFLHFGWLHLAINMLGLYFLGRFVEVSIDYSRYLAVYLISGVVSMLAFSILTIQFGDKEQLLVGASSAIMGLVGVIVAMFLRDWWKEKSRIASKRLSFVLLVVAIQFLFDFTTPEISFLSHILGLVTGFTVGSIFLIK